MALTMHGVLPKRIIQVIQTLSGFSGKTTLNRRMQLSLGFLTSKLFSLAIE